MHSQKYKNNILVQMSGITEYYGFSSTNALSGTPIKESLNNMMQDQNMDIKSNPTDKTVIDPYGYGYIPTMNETRLKDSNDIQIQEQNVFVVGAITGVALIVLGLLLSSSSDISPTIQK
jgi:hypothetical protein